MAVVGGSQSPSDCANYADHVSDVNRPSENGGGLNIKNLGSPLSSLQNTSMCHSPSPTRRQCSASSESDCRNFNLPVYYQDMLRKNYERHSCFTRSLNIPIRNPVLISNLDNISEELINGRVHSTDSSATVDEQFNQQSSNGSSQSKLPDNLMDLIVNGTQSPDSYIDPEISDPVADTKVTNDTHSSTKKGKNAVKPKRPSERKRKGPSWYSVLSPTYKSRSEHFKRIFKDLPPNERLIVEYSCALQKDILVHGRLYISREWICFYANIFRWETVLTIRCKDIVRVSKERTAKVIPNAIQICTKDDRYFFTSFGARDKTFLILDRVWKSSINDQVLTQQELWQWVHYSYGEDLGLSSNDDIDYIFLPSDDKIKFQVRVQREEKLAEQVVDYTLNGRLNKVAVKEPSDDYVANLPVPSFVIGGSADTDHDLSTTTDSTTSPRYRWSNHLDSPDLLMSEGSAAAALPGAILTSEVGGVLDAHHISSEDGDDTTEDEEAERPCSGHSHFAIPVVDELLNIPIDDVFEHCFTDSAVYRDFVTNKKTFAAHDFCRRHAHFDISCHHGVIEASADAVFTAIFTDSPLQKKFMTQRETKDVILSPWPDEADSTGIKVRNISYTLSLNYSIGPKYSPSTERQIMYPETRPGHFYLIDTECVNGGIPYGENFYVVNRFCIARVSSTKCRLRITSQIKYRKSVWGIVKNFIEKNAAAGLIESFNVLAELLRQESNRLAQVQLTAQPSLSRKRALRRRRISERGVVMRPSVADVPHLAVSKHSTPVKHVPASIKVNVKPDEQWYLKLSASSLIRIVCLILVTLMLFNAFLLYKLWSLETRTSLEMLSKQDYSRFFHKQQPRYAANDGWSQLLSEQKQLYETEIERWKAVLSNTIKIMDHMVHSLTDLRSSIDHANEANFDPPTSIEGHGVSSEAA